MQKKFAKGGFDNLGAAKDKKGDAGVNSINDFMECDPVAIVKSDRNVATWAKKNMHKMPEDMHCAMEAFFVQLPYVTTLIYYNFRCRNFEYQPLVNFQRSYFVCH